MRVAVVVVDGIGDTDVAAFFVFFGCVVSVDAIVCAFIVAVRMIGVAVCCGLLVFANDVVDANGIVCVVDVLRVARCPLMLLMHEVFLMGGIVSCVRCKCC